MGCIGAPIAALLSIVTFGLIGSLRSSRPATPELAAYQAAERSVAKRVAFWFLVLFIAMSAWAYLKNS